MLIEDNPTFRKAISCTLADEPGLELTDAFSTTEAALRSLEDHPNNPDLILLDIELPGMSGIEAIPHLKELRPDTKILMLTQSDNESDVVQAIQYGAAGYLLKSSSLEEITQGIKSVHSGEASLDAAVAKFIVKALHKRHPKPKADVYFSVRENEVLILMSEGLSKKQMADRLGIGIHTVGDYVKEIYRKLNVQNAPGAVSKAFRAGILSVDDSE